MAANTLSVKLILRNDTLTNWNSSALVLQKGEPALLAKSDGTFALYIGDGSKTFAQLSPSTLTPSEITNAISTAIQNDAVNTISVASGTNNGTIKVTVDGVTSDNIAVTGLGSAAFTESTAYATADQGTLADNAMPKSGGTFTGAVTMSGDPTQNLHAATKQYVDTQISNSIAASDAMVFRGTIGTNGSVTALPTNNVVQGDTYKVIADNLSVAANVSYTSAAVTAKPGDLVVAMGEGKWLVVPSGDEDVTTVAYSTTSVSLSTTAQTGSVTFGEAATKQVDTSITAASTSTNLPTSQAVAAFVEGKGYLTTDENVKSEATTNAKIYLLGSTAAGTETATVKKNVSVYVDTDGKLKASNGFVGDVTGNASTASALTSGISVSLSGGVTGSTAAAANAGDTATVAVTSVNTDYLNVGTKDLILDGGDAEAT